MIQRTVMMHRQAQPIITQRRQCLKCLSWQLEHVSRRQDSILGSYSTLTCDLLQGSGLRYTPLGTAQPSKRLRLLSIRTRAEHTEGGASSSAGSITGSTQSASLSAEDIQQRIMQARARKASQTSYHCPACDILVGTPLNLAKHMERCCPDIWDKHAWQAVCAQPRQQQHGPASVLVASARACEEQLRDRVLDVTFRGKAGSLSGSSSSVASSSSPISELVGSDDLDFESEEAASPRMAPPEVAAVMGLPLKRVSLLLRRALDAVPLAIDHEEVQVVYEDEYFVAVNKPPGVRTAPIHRFTGGSMVNRLIAYLGHPPYVLHRLDMNTSGLLLFAKRQEVVTAVHLQFRQRKVSKYYAAVTIGVPQQHVFEVAAPIDHHPTVGVARRTATTGKEASTSFVLYAANASAQLQPHAQHGAVFDPLHAPMLAAGGASLMLCAPHTGRTHQIRAHLQHAGYPIIGDELYGIEGPWIERQALHAAAMELTHPVTKATLILSAPLPPDFVACLEALGLPDFDSASAAKHFEQTPGSLKSSQ